MEEKICNKCKKVFIPAPEHIYKDGDNIYCSWTCYNHRKDGVATHGPRMVEVYDKDGDLTRRFASVRKAADFTGFNEQTIREACRTGRLYQGFIWKYKE